MPLAVIVIAVVDGAFALLLVSDVESAWPVIGLGVLSAIAGFAAGRWWAIALAYALLFVFIPLHSEPERQELSMLGWMLFGAVPTATAQAILLALGVGVRKVIRRRGLPAEGPATT